MSDNYDDAVLIDTGLPIHVSAFFAKPRCQPRPALMTDQCNGWSYNRRYTGQGEEPMMVQCQNKATRRVVVDDGLDCHTKKLCAHCAVLLRREASRNGNEIISDEPLAE